jgi:hypothetical protein
LLVGFGVVAAGSALDIIFERALLPSLMIPRRQGVEFTFTVAALAVFLACTVLGGYLTARFSRYGTFRNPLLLSLAVLPIIFVLVRLGAPLVFLVPCFVFVLPAAWFGSSLAIRQRA